MIRRILSVLLKTRELEDWVSDADWSAWEAVINNGLDVDGFKR